MSHPVGKVTRLGESGYGVRRYVANAFAGKTAQPSHPVGKLLRLGEAGYGVRRYKPNAFAGRSPSQNATEYIYFARHRGRR